MDKTFDMSCYFLTTISYINTKIFRMDTNDNPLFLGPMLLHRSSASIVFTKFLKHLRKRMERIARELRFTGDLSSIFVFSTDHEKANTTSIDNIFPNSTRILCSRHIKANIGRKLESKSLTHHVQELVKCESEVHFWEGQSAIKQDPNFTNCLNKVQQYILVKFVKFVILSLNQNGG